MPHEPDVPVTQAELETVRSAVFAIGLAMLRIEDVLEALVNESSKEARWSIQEYMRALRASLEDFSGVVRKFPDE